MKVFTGKVVSVKMAKTATVAVERFLTHPIYKKRFKRVKKYHVHDELGVKDGDRVKFTASKPYSKMVKWIILEVVGEKKAVSVTKKVKEEKK
jgi:small subunit ribosomal protein S17